MNRSIFQIVRGVSLNKIVYLLLLFLFVYFFLNCENVFCFGIKGVSEPLLKDFVYKNITVKKSLNISDLNSFNALEVFFSNYHINKFIDLKISKYYTYKNGVPVMFHHKTCLAHPNLFLGLYNNVYFNYQFSHNNYNNSFSIITRSDLINNFKNQLICKQLYLYDGDLGIQYLNFNDVNLNKFEVYENFKKDEIQNYLDSEKKTLYNFLDDNFNSKN